MFKETVVASAVVALLGGCANPILKIEAPGYDVDASPAPKSKEPQSMAEAMSKLNNFRANYYKAIRDQTGQMQDATTGLVWLGTLLTGAAIGNAHRDVMVSGALLGGTTYGLSRTMLDARRIQVWTEGIKALDCAKDASMPLDIGDERHKKLREAGADLDGKRAAVEGAKNDVKWLLDGMESRVGSEIDLAMQAMGKSGPDESDTKAMESAENAIKDQINAAKAALAKVDAAIIEVDKTSVAAGDLLRATRGGELSVAVDRIHTKVTEAMNGLVVDISSVKQQIAGLGGYASIFAPGSGIDSTIGQSFDNYKQIEKAAQSAATEVQKIFRRKNNTEMQLSSESLVRALKDAMDRLERNARDMSVVQSRVHGLLGGVNHTAVSEALKRCDVAGVVTPIVLAPASLEFDSSKSQTKSFTISGGVPPYEVTMLDAAPEGLSLQFSGGFSDSVLVKMDKDKPKPSKDDIYRIRVSDSATAKKPKILEVKVVVGK